MTIPGFWWRIGWSGFTFRRCDFVQDMRPGFARFELDRHNSWVSVRLFGRVVVAYNCPWGGCSCLRGASMFGISVWKYRVVKQ